MDIKNFKNFIWDEEEIHKDDIIENTFENLEKILIETKFKLIIIEIDKKYYERLKILMRKYNRELPKTHNYTDIVFCYVVNFSKYQPGTGWIIVSKIDVLRYDEGILHNKKFLPFKSNSPNYFISLKN